MMIAAGTHASCRSNSLVITSDGGMLNNGWLIPGVCDVAAVAAQNHLAVWVTTQGLVWKAALDPYSTETDATKLLRRTMYQTPVLVRHAFGNAPVRDVAMGINHSVFLLFDGRVLGSGNNIAGCLGWDDSRRSIDAPEPIPGTHLLGAAMSVSAGENSTGIILSNGKAYVMGMNCFGQLGLGLGPGSTTNNRRSLTYLEFPSPVLQLSMNLHGVAVLRNGDAYTWGRNDVFQCGTGDNKHSYTPLLVRGPWSPLGVSSFACGNSHTVFLDMEGKAFMAGTLSTVNNEPLLNETFTSVLGLPQTIVAVASTNDRSVYVCIDGGVYEGGVFAGGFSDVPVQRVPHAVPRPMALQTSGVNLTPRAIYPANILAFAMGLHYRLGAESVCRVLKDDVVLRMMWAGNASPNECEDRRIGTAISARARAKQP